MRSEHLTMRRKVGSCRGRDSSTKFVVSRQITNAQDGVGGNATTIAYKWIGPRRLRKLRPLGRFWRVTRTTDHIVT